MPAPSLYEVQRLFWESVAVQPGRDSIAPAFVRLVRGYDDTDRKTRIGVYADAYFLRLRDVLGEDFPRVAALLADRFDEVVKGYLEAFPSRWPSVRHLGHALSEFLRRRTDTPKCLADLAELEWARIEVFDAPDAECATIEDFVSIPAEAWPALRFSAIPAIKILRAQYPVHHLWSGERSLEVTAGETIGFVGRTGVKVSPPHLHFEVRVDDRVTNPLRTLGDFVIPPQATMTHQYVLKARRAKRRHLHV